MAFHVLYTWYTFDESLFEKWMSPGLILGLGGLGRRLALEKETSVRRVEATAMTTESLAYVTYQLTRLHIDHQRLCA